ncbi:hypothetical protein MAQ5080_00332 [Marinomonas aquimarina]|uniref:DUF2914 domain-containing protein n=1 Tax=Marinomonas aquimarina TaxID=295068 RepID=A0A1A8T3N4_9GAMM|nr:DUF2914 domain-containing protein [Marinomonas aquimarina]SBS25678.1 hypothetical protein MAQ5080_00332 [Marinomonas aquimarina]
MQHTLIRSMLLCLALTSAPIAMAEGTVARALFASEVLDREPIDELGDVIKVEYGEIQRVYFFTDLRDMDGSQIAHVWKLNGQVEVEIPFDIGGDRWRVWSSKRLMPGFDGKWSVDVVKNGEVLESRSFDYVDEW